MRSKDEYLRLYEQFGIRPIGGGSGESDSGEAEDAGKNEGDPRAGSPPGDKGDKNGSPVFTPEQDQYVNKLIARAKREGEGLGKSAAERTAKEAEDRLKAERERQEAEARGEFDAVKQSLEGERDTFKTKADELTARVEAYEKLAAARVETVKATIPAEALEDFPADADALAQLTWLEARSKLVEKLAPGAGKEGAPRVPRTPQPQGTLPDQRIDAEIERLRRTGAYGI